MLNRDKLKIGGTKWRLYQAERLRFYLQLNQSLSISRGTTGRYLFPWWWIQNVKLPGDLFSIWGNGGIIKDADKPGAYPGVAKMIMLLSVGWKSPGFPFSL
jgi:hypothetical protein